MKFFSELKRRNVFRAGAAYLAGAWLLMQVADIVLPRYGFDEALVTTLITILAIGFPLALVLAWAYELTPQGLKRDAEVDRAAPDAIRTDKTLDRVIIIVLTLALGFFAVDKFVLDPLRDAERTEVAAQAAVKEALTELENQGPPEHSIAVLPFLDLSAAQDQAYFSDGIAEELLNLLAKIPQLQVTSRTSAFAFKGKEVNMGEIAEVLKVAHILEGSVRRIGDRVRITTQLIDTRSDTHLWSETYDRTMEDIFVVQNEISQAVVDALKVKLLGGPAKARQTDPETYALYLRALHANRLQTPEGHAEALSLLQRALLLDSSYAPSWSLLGWVYWGNQFWRSMPLEESTPLAREAALTALEHDPAEGQAHALLVDIYTTVDRDLEAAAGAAEAALAVGQIDPVIVQLAAVVAKTLGRMELSIELFDYAIARDPLVAYYNTLQAINYYYVGRLEDAKASVQNALLLDPDGFQARGMMAYLLYLEGDFEGALAEAALEPWKAMSLAATTMIYHGMGEQQKSDEALRTMVENIHPESNWFLWVYAFRGENDAALQWLEQNVDKTNYGILAEAQTEPMFSEIRRDPRFHRVMETAGLSKEQLAAIDFELNLPR